MTNYDKLDQSLNIPSNIVEVEKQSLEIEISSQQEIKKDDIKKDYDYVRANLYSLIEKGQEGINGIMELAAESGSPRAYEVAGQLIKSVADTTDKIMSLHKNLKDIEEISNKTPNTVTNNAVFVGSTSDLSKLLKQGFLNNKE